LPDYFKIDGAIVNDPKEIADNFNVYYNNIGPRLASQIPNLADVTFREYLREPVPEHFKFSLISTSTIDKIISRLAPKTSCGTDGLSVKFVKEIKDIIVLPLTTLVNQSFQTGIFPTKLKCAKIIPVHKKDDIHKIDNYRPISILPALSKIFEKAMLIQLHSHFDAQNLYFDNQYGFRQGHSTEYAVVENIDRVIENLENRKLPVNIFLDLSKAFDTLDHDILTSKLHNYGIRGDALNLCKSYLEDRTQQVEYNNELSQSLTIRTGVPQGSILGPFFFLVYVNDFARSTNMFKFIMYADDTTLLATLCNSNSSNSQNNMEDHLNAELNKINNWLRVNKLSLNLDKTTYMLFHTLNKPVPNINLQIEGSVIRRVDYFDFLGIVIDKNLTWKYHVNKIGKKISKTIGIMTRLKHYLPSVTLKTIYNSLINCHLLYGITLWGHKQNQIFKMQKRAVRIISKSKYNAHTEPLFKLFNIPKLNDILKIQEWKFYHSLVNKKLPKFFENFSFPRHVDVHAHQTRNNAMMIVPRLNYNISKCAIRNRLPSIVNSAPTNITEKLSTHSINGLTFYLKRIFIDSYETTCYIENCYICGNN